MPLYEFCCASCGLIFEDLVRASDPATQCPQCQGTSATRLLSSFASPAGTSGPVCSPSDCAMAAPSGGGCCGGACHH